MDIEYVLKLLKEAQGILREITPKLEHAFKFGTAEGCIGVAITHIESRWLNKEG